MTELRSHVHCYVLGNTAKCRFWFFQVRCAHKSGDVIDFIIVACRISSQLKWYKNCKSRLRLAKVIVKNKMSLFMVHCVDIVSQNSKPKNRIYWHRQQPVLFVLKKPGYPVFRFRQKLWTTNLSQSITHVYSYTITDIVSIPNTTVSERPTCRRGSFSFGDIVTYCSNFGHFAFMSHPFGLRDNVQCSFWAHWKARSGFSIS